MTKKEKTSKNTKKDTVAIAAAETAIEPTKVDAQPEEKFDVTPKAKADIKVIDIPIAETDDGIDNILFGYEYKVNANVAAILNTAGWQTSNCTVCTDDVKTISLLKRLYHRGYTNRKISII